MVNKKKFIGFCILFLLLSTLAYSLDYTKDTIFTDLKENNADKLESVFTFDNPLLNTLDNNLIYFTFDEVCGKVLDYDILAYQLCDKTKQIHIWRNETVCIEDNLSKQHCDTVREFDHYETQPYQEYGYCPLVTIPVTPLDIKLANVQIQRDKCDNGEYGYFIDWKPIFNDKGTETIKDTWAWWNLTHASRYQVNLTCNRNDGDCVQEFIVINYSMLTDCDTDLRFIYNDTVLVPFELDDTNKLLYTMANVSQGTTDTNYYIYCDNDLIGDGTDEDVVIFWEDCEDTTDWSKVDNDALLLSNTTYTDGITNHGSVCQLVIPSSDEAWDEIYKPLTPHTATGVLYYADIFRPEIYGNGDRGALFVGNGFDGNDGTFTYITSTDDYRYIVATTGFTLKHPVYDGWYYRKQMITLDDTDDVDYFLNGTHASAFNKGFRNTNNGSMTYVKASSGYSTDGITIYYADSMVISRYNVSIYQDAMTYSLGGQELSNSNPTVSNVTITQSPIYSDSQLNCSSIPQDAENITLDLSFAWWQNDAICDGCGYNVTLQTTNNTLTYTSVLVSEQLYVGDNWTCLSRSFDGNSYSEWSNTTLQVQNTALNWSHTINDLSFIYTQNVTYDYNATDIDVNQDIEYFLNSSGLVDIDNTTGIINWSTSVSDIGTYVLLLNATDGYVWINATINLEITNTTPIVTPVTHPILSEYDLSTLQNVFVLFLLVFVWLGMLIIGTVFNNFVFAGSGLIIGMVVGFMFASVHIIFTIVLVLVNAFSMFVMFNRGK